MQAIVTSWARAHIDKGAWVAQHVLRHQIFIDRMAYNVRTGDGLEYDQFDTPEARYVVIMDRDYGSALACVRLVLTPMPTMVQALWPSLLGGL